MADAHGLFFNSQDGDRVYNADSFAEWLRKFFTSGVFNGELQVTVANGMTVQVGTGYANTDGKIRFFDAVTQLTLDTAHGTYPRIDTVVVERNDTDRGITLKVVKGAYSGANPVPTPPVRSNGVYQLVLAQIRVNAGATAITQANITDTRANNSLCGWVVGTVDRVDVEQMTAQAQADFLAWYDRMKDQLSEDAAGNLQLEIDTLDNTVDGVKDYTDSVQKLLINDNRDSRKESYSRTAQYAHNHGDILMMDRNGSYELARCTRNIAVGDSFSSGNVVGTSAQTYANSVLNVLARALGVYVNGPETMSWDGSFNAAYSHAIGDYFFGVLSGGESPDYWLYKATKTITAGATVDSSYYTSATIIGALNAL